MSSASGPSSETAGGTPICSTACDAMSILVHQLVEIRHLADPSAAR
jgi:hypothetical protein